MNDTWTIQTNTIVPASPEHNMNMLCKLANSPHVAVAVMGMYTGMQRVEQAGLAGCVPTGLSHHSTRNNADRVVGPEFVWSGLIEYRECSSLSEE